VVARSVVVVVLVVIGLQSLPNVVEV